MQIMSILFFNLELLEAKSQCDPTLMLSMIKAHFDKKLIPKNNRDKTVLKSLVGNSYLLNVEPLFSDSADIVYKAQYIRLAGRRDYTAFKFYAHKHLDLTFFSDLDLDAIKHNPLLKITDNKIYFKYEN